MGEGCMASVIVRKEEIKHQREVRGGVRDWQANTAVKRLFQILGQLYFVWTNLHVNRKACAKLNILRLLHKPIQDFLKQSFSMVRSTRPANATRCRHGRSIKSENYTSARSSTIAESNVQVCARDEKHKFGSRQKVTCLGCDQYRDGPAL